MSIKIYEAYRFPLARLNEFVTHSRAVMMEGFLKKVDELMPFVWKREREDIKAEVAAWKHMQNAEQEDLERAWRLRAWWKLQEELAKAARSSQKSLYDVEAVWNFWIYGEMVYAIPYGLFKNGAKKLGWVEDFSYWNSTDPPDDVSEDEFRARGEVWKKICLDDWNGLRLMHVVVDFAQPAPHAAGVAMRHVRSQKISDYSL